MARELFSPSKKFLLQTDKILLEGFHLKLDTLCAGRSEHEAYLLLKNAINYITIALRIHLQSVSTPERHPRLLQHEFNSMSSLAAWLLLNVCCRETRWKEAQTRCEAATGLVTTKQVRVEWVKTEKFLITFWRIPEIARQQNLVRARKFPWYEELFQQKKNQSLS